VGQGSDHHLVAFKENTTLDIEGLTIETLLELLVGVMLLITWVFVQLTLALY
jgi:hypothetical protein